MPQTERCACCGQTTAGVARLTVRVDAALLAYCNLAHDAARRLAAPDITIAHVIAVMAADRDRAGDVARAGLSAEAALNAARAVIERAPRGGNGSPPRASEDVRRVLTRAELAAFQASRDYATPGDFVCPLMESGIDVAFAGALRGARGGTGAVVPASGARFEAMSRRTSASIRTTSNAHASGRWHSLQSTRARSAERSGDAAAELLAVLTQRLARIEQHLAGQQVRENERPEHASRLQGRLVRRAWHWRSAIPDRAAAARVAQTNPEAAPAGAADDEGLDSGAWERESDTDAAEELSPPGDRPKRFYLAIDDEIVCAPSIGPKTAARLIACGIHRVRDLLACDPEAVRAGIAARHITAQRIRQWQAQARLVCTIPWLRGTHAQLLTGAGFGSLDALLATDPPTLCAAVLRFVLTRDGQSVLRSNAPPDIQRLSRWLTYAMFAEPQRAA